MCVHANTQGNSQRRHGLSCISKLFLYVLQPPGAMKQIKVYKFCLWPQSPQELTPPYWDQTASLHTPQSSRPWGEFTAAQHLGRIWISSWRNSDEISRATQRFRSVPGSSTHDFRTPYLPFLSKNLGSLCTTALILIWGASFQSPLHYTHCLSPADSLLMGSVLTKGVVSHQVWLLSIEPWQVQLRNYTVYSIS